MSTPNARLITLEGIDGAGKSTHVLWMANLLRTHGHEVLVTREPGGTELGDAIRDLLLTKTMCIHSEMLLVCAARMQHLSAVIEPALARNTWVISDRFIDATYAYQGGGRGIPIQVIQAFEQLLHPQRGPDLTFFFDLPPQHREMRCMARDQDRFEQEEEAFFDRVRAVYLQRSQDHARFCTLDALADIASIRRIITARLLDVCQSEAPVCMMDNQDA